MCGGELLEPIFGWVAHQTEEEGEGERREESVRDKKRKEEEQKTSLSYFCEKAFVQKKPTFFSKEH